MKSFRLALLSLAILVTVSACGSGEGVDPSSILNPQPGEGTVSPAALIILSPSKAVIKPDNIDASEIAAYVLSSSNVLLPDVLVFFSTTGGAINSASATTDSSGKAKITFTSGALQNDATATISATSGTSTGTTTILVADQSIPAKIELSAAPASILSNNTDLSVLTATVKNTAGGTLPNITVTFKADDGEFVGSTTVSTDASGRASISFRSGSDKSNRSTMVTASTTGGISENFPIVIFGSTLALAPNVSPTLMAVGQTEKVTVTARDASSNVVPGVAITFAAAGTGGLNLSTTTATTDSNGQATVDVTGGSLGTATLTVTGLGVTATKTYDISGVSGDDFFRIIAPDTEHSSASLATAVPIRVSAPDPTSQVLFVTTLGQWGNGSGILTVPVVAGVAEAQLTSNLAGLATVQVSDQERPSLTDSVSISFSAAAHTASRVDLQASATNMNTTVASDAPQQIELRATVRNADNQVVGGAPVAFSIETPTGGGEFISPPVAYTDNQGMAVTTFTSGILQGDVSVAARLVDFPDKISSITINIGGLAMSITMGRATVGTALSATTYSLPMSVLVSDGMGGPVSGIPVSLTVWPVAYLANDLAHYPNEDLNENGIKDPGEDINCDGQLTPPASVAGNIIPSPPIVTDETGLGNFDLIYLKAHYGTYVRVRATALVGGSETSSTMLFHLPFLVADQNNLPAPTFLPPVEGGCGP